MRAESAQQAAELASDVEEARSDLASLLAEVRRMEASGVRSRRPALLEELSRVRSLVDGLEARLLTDAGPEHSRVVVDLTEEGERLRSRVAAFYTDLDRPSRYQTLSAHLPHLGEDVERLRESVESLRKHMPDMGK